jgi:hypothetical protein
MLTLYTTPVVYLYLDRLRIWLDGFRHDVLDSVRGLTGRPRPEFPAHRADARAGGAGHV